MLVHSRQQRNKLQDTLQSVEYLLVSVPSLFLSFPAVPEYCPSAAVQASFLPQLAMDAPHERALATPCSAGMHIEHQSVSCIHTQHVEEMWSRASVGSCGWLSGLV
jgi:hypothetical protein